MAEKFTPAQFEELKNLTRYFFQEMLKPIDSELVVHATVLNLLKMAYPDTEHMPAEPLPQIINAALTAVRAKPELRAAMHEKYQASLERFFQRFREESPELKALREWLQDWNPTGPIN